ncbi:MAG: DUF4266 domain-containing protein [Pseudomonadota bacterium]
MKTPYLLLALTLILGSLAGCSSIKPWVKPYERTNLADPIMSFSRDPVQETYMHHVYQARESARGAEGGGGGGCGCN